MRTPKPLPEKYYNPIKQNDPKKEIEQFIGNLDEFLDASAISKIDELIKKVKENPDNLILIQEMATAIESYCYVENGSMLKYSTIPRYGKPAKELRAKMIKEYKAQSISEKMTIDLAISAYFRLLHSNAVYQKLIENSDGSTLITLERTRLIRELNKQIEIASKQYTSMLTLLRELKTPPVSVKIKTDNAFIGTSQQFNKNA